MAWIKWTLSQMAAGAVRWLTSVVIGGVCLALGFAPAAWLAAIIGNPPAWLVSVWFRIAIVVVGVVAVAAILLVRRSRTATENPSVTYVTNHNTINFSYESDEDDRTFVKFSPSNFRVANSANISSVTDNGRNDYTIAFASDFPSSDILVIPAGDTPRDFEVANASPGSVRLRFKGDNEPNSISLTFKAGER